MCTQINSQDFNIVHHEMGHIQYYMQYRHQPALFRSGANAAFHEAVGDTIALSVTTEGHLRAIGLDTRRQDNARASSKTARREEYSNCVKFIFSFFTVLALALTALVLCVHTIL